MSIDRKAFLGTTGLGVLTARLFGLTESETEDPEPAAAALFVRHRFHESEIEEWSTPPRQARYSVTVDEWAFGDVQCGDVVRLSLDVGAGEFCEGLWQLESVESGRIGSVWYTSAVLMSHDVRIVSRASYRVVRFSGLMTRSA